MASVIAPDSLPDKLPDEAHATTAHDHDTGASLLPFVFAKRHGILIRGPQDNSYLTIVRENANPTSLSEARRVAGGPLSTRLVSADEFETLLNETYEQGSQDAMHFFG